MSDEFSRIAKYFAPLAGPEGFGLKDDAAVFAPPPERELVITADQMLQGVHFLPGDAPALIARKLLRRNLSDLAAMGAMPLGYLLTTALPPDVSEEWLAEFAEGLRQDQEEYGLSLFGGDSSSSLSHISLSITMLGHITPGAALRRNGAHGGDEIWVTGAIGDAALGLQARRGILRDESGYLTQRSLLPSPRMGLALAGIATAAIDISDGLVQDLQHICQESNVAAEIFASLVPASPQVASFGDAVLETRLTGGDDYELLLAVPAGNADTLRNACGALPVTKIGVFRAGEPRVGVVDQRGAIMQFSKSGWRHF